LSAIKDLDNMSKPLTVWDAENLAIPRPPLSLVDNLTVFSYGHYGTVAKPEPESDYMLEPALHYLSGEIPDQYVLSNWGHGINSYSLNFRCAYSDIAFIGQVAYGGVYGDRGREERRWEDLVSDVDQIMDTPIRKPAGKSRKRKFIIAYSDFRTVSAEARHRSDLADHNYFTLFRNTNRGLKELGIYESVNMLEEKVASILGGYTPS
jgi:hypothetical protein